MTEILSTRRYPPDRKVSFSLIMKKYKWRAQLFDPSKKKDLEGILNLVKSHYNNVDECYSEYFQWEYMDNPAGNAIIWIAKYNDEVVGQYVANLIKVKIGGRIRLGSISIKTLTRKDFRGKGIHIYLANKTFENCRNKGVDFTYGFPNQKVYKPSIERLGIIDMGRVPLLVRPLNIRKLIEEYIKNKVYVKLLKAFTLPLSISYNFIFKVFSLKENKIIKNKKIFIKEIDRFDERISAFWEKIKMNYKNIVVRNKKFLNWRYFKNPRRNYKIFIAEDDKGEIISYVILRISYMSKIKVGYIADILSNEEKLGNLACSLLIREAVDYFEKNSVVIISCLMLSNKIYFRLLRRNRFLVCPRRFKPQPFSFIMKVNTNSIANDLLKLDDWFIVMGDYDVV